MAEIVSLNAGLLKVKRNCPALIVRPVSSSKPTKVLPVFTSVQNLFVIFLNLEVTINDFFLLFKVSQIYLMTSI